MIFSAPKSGVPKIERRKLLQRLAPVWTDLSCSVVRIDQSTQLPTTMISAEYLSDFRRLDACRSLFPPDLTLTLD